MGGNAITDAVHMDVQRYAVISKEILELLKRFYSDCFIPFEKPGKTSHGDVDVICVLDKNGPHPNGCDAIKDLGSRESNRNGHIVSFEYKTHQIDIIHVNNVEEAKFSRFFYSYGDVGMITGMIVRTVGLKMGDRKLALYLEEFAQSIILTSDIEKVFQFFDWDYSDWEANSKTRFRTERDIFEWLSSNRYFRYSMFKRDALKCELRKREKDRDMFSNFVDFCNEGEIASPPSTPYASHRLKEFAKSDRIKYEDVVVQALSYFEKQQEYDDIVAHRAMKADIKEKYNGRFIMEWVKNETNYELQGAELGRFMKHVSEIYPDEKLWTMEADHIKTDVLQHWEIWRRFSPKRKQDSDPMTSYNNTT